MSIVITTAEIGSTTGPVYVMTTASIPAARERRVKLRGNPMAGPGALVTSVPRRVGEVG